MKTHLPVALRKALLTAIFAVAGTMYNAYAGETAQAVSYGDITTKNTTINESGSVSVGVVTDNADNLSITSTNGDVSIGAIQTASRESVEGLKVQAAGDLAIGESGDAGNGDEESRIPATIANASIQAGGDFTIGETQGAANIFTICGTEEESSTVVISVGGDFVVNQSAVIHPGGGSGACGDLTLTAGGDIEFYGRLTNIQGGGQGSDARATLTATTGRILITGADVCTLGEGAVLIAEGEGGKVELLNEDGVHSIAGDISTSGRIEVDSVYNHIDSKDNVVDFDAGQGIFITSRESGEIIAYNGISHADMTAEDKGISIFAEDGTLGNYISASTLTAEKEDVTISGGDAASVTGSTVKAISGEVTITGGAAYVEDSTVTASRSVEIRGTETDGNGTGLSHVNVEGQTVSVGGDSRTTISAHEGYESSIKAEEKVLVTGTTVTISDDTTITSTVDDVDIIATSGKAAVTGGSVSALQGIASIGGATETKLAGVAVEGAGIAVGSGTGCTVIGSDAEKATTLNATGDISVKDKNVLIEEDSGIISHGGDVEIAATDDKLELTGGSVMTGGGNITISGAAGTTVTSTEVFASATTEENGTVAIGQPGEGDTLLDGARVMAEGQTIVSGQSNELKNEASVQGAAGVALSAASVNDVADGSRIASESGGVTLAAARNLVQEGSSVFAGGDVRMESSNLNKVTNATVLAEGDVFMGAAEGSSAIPDNRVVSSDEDTRVDAVRSVFLQGANVVCTESQSNGRACMVANQGDINMAGENLILRATLHAGGAVRITTGEGDMTTRVENSTFTGGGVSIAGDTTSRADDDLAVVTGEDMLVEAGAITLNNVSVVNTGKAASNIWATNGGDLAVWNRVDIENATLTAAGHIDVGSGDVLNVRKDATLQGGLSGSGDVNKSGGDALVLAHDSTAFSGAIYVNGAVGGAGGSVVDADNAGTWVEITGAGVGAESFIVLKNTDLVVDIDDEDSDED